LAQALIADRIAAVLSVTPSPTAPKLGGLQGSAAARAVAALNANASAAPKQWRPSDVSHALNSPCFMSILLAGPSGDRPVRRQPLRRVDATHGQATLRVRHVADDRRSFTTRSGMSGASQTSPPGCGGRAEAQATAYLACAGLAATQTRSDQPVLPPEKRSDSHPTIPHPSARGSVRRSPVSFC